MPLTAEQQAAREGKVTAGFAPYLMAGKKERILSEWMRLVGHPELKEPDWESMWNLHYGSVIEPIALDWHQKRTGKELMRRGEVVVHPQLPYVSCTLDAYRADDDIVIDCKAWSSWQKVDYICSFLAPQIIVQRACTQASGGALLLVHGGAEPKEYPLIWSADYEAEVWERINQFWRCVLDLIPPVDMPANVANDVIATRRVDMQHSNAWAHYAADWLEYRDAAKAFDVAKEELKKLIPEDVAEARGHGIIALRNKAGSIAIRETDR